MSHDVCKSCGSFGPFKDELAEFGPHHGKKICCHCGSFYKWIPKPKNETKRPPNKISAEDLGISHCQLCGRPRARLGNRGVLESHHVIEIQDGGEDVKENIWIVCTSCHSLIHHQRTYLNRHLEGQITKERLKELMDQDGVPESVRGHMFAMLERSSI
jgi:hypothetical protein